MDALKKDFDSRKYKSNPFEQKYVDLTTSSCADSCDLVDVSLDLRARADIIGCQVAFLVKVVSTVSANFTNCDNSAVSNTKLKKENGKKLNQERDRQNQYFANYNGLKNISKHLLLKRLENNPGEDLPTEIMNGRLLWLEELIKSIKMSNLKEIVTPFTYLSSQATISRKSVGFLKEMQRSKVGGEKNEKTNRSGSYSTDILLSTM